MKRIVCLTTIFVLITSSICMAQYGRRPARREPIFVPLEKLLLPEPDKIGTATLEQTLVSVVNTTAFSSEPLDLKLIGQLAWAGAGVLQKEQQAEAARPAIIQEMPIELYIIIPTGVYRYNPIIHGLEKNIEDDIRSRLSATAARGNLLDRAPCNIVVAGSSQRLAGKSHVDTTKLMHLQIGRAGQRIRLQAASLGLSLSEVTNFQQSQVKRLCGLAPNQVPVLIIATGFAPGVSATTIEKAPKSTSPGYSPKTALVVSIGDKFHDTQLFDTMDVLASGGVKTELVSWEAGIIKGMRDGTAEASASIEDVIVANYDAVVFIGGTGVRKYYENRLILDIVRQAANRGKVLAAIGRTPPVLANAGIMNGIRATSYYSQRRYLIDAGALFTANAVERDELIVTARDEKAASQFGRAIIDALARKSVSEPNELEQQTGRYDVKKPRIPQGW